MTATLATQFDESTTVSSQLYLYSCEDTGLHSAEFESADLASAIDETRQGFVDAIEEPGADGWFLTGWVTCQIEVANHTTADGYDPDGHAADCDECFHGEITIEPPELDCNRGETHKWDVRGAYAASGNGVFELDECRHCGMERKTGRWGENSMTGEQDREATAYRHRDDVPSSN